MPAMASRRARTEGEEVVRVLPDQARSILDVVIGAAMQFIAEAVDGSSIGAKCAASSTMQDTEKTSIVSNKKHRRPVCYSFSA